ncbi:MAG: hypothetical protein BWK76_20575 [Desulfobulbaceae bacterium A2]|nr:MAG: hypothetical protein BWK76_20575 [Desulfobulbaceae bacterium A2]
MNIVSSTQDSISIAALVGRMDAVTTTEFDRYLADQRGRGVTQLVLDLQELEYISSAGLRSILQAAKQLKAQNGALLLCRLGGTVAEVFKMSGFLTIIPSFADTEEACASLRQP